MLPFHTANTKAAALRVTSFAKAQTTYNPVHGLNASGFSMDSHL